MAAPRAKMSTWTLGAIMVLVPTSFAVGTVLNKKYEDDRKYGNASSETAISAPRQPSAELSLSSNEEISILQARLKSLKMNRVMLENTLKDDRDKMNRLQERIRRQSEKDAASAAAS